MTRELHDRIAVLERAAPRRSSDTRVRAARATAAEELGLGSGCLDGACIVNGPTPRGQCTNGGCRCYATSSRYRPGDHEAALILIAERAIEIMEKTP